MELVRKILSLEPLLISRLLASGAAVLIALGVPIDNARVEAAVEATAVLFGALNLLMAALERQTVYSPATHDADVSAAYDAGATER